MTQPGRPPLPDPHADAANAGVTRARAVVRGLLRTGRAGPRGIADAGDQVGEFTRLDRKSVAGSFYWIRRDGSEIRVGSGFVDAEPLQLGFVEKMAAAGAA